MTASFKTMSEYIFIYNKLHSLTSKQTFFNAKTAVL